MSVLFYKRPDYTNKTNGPINATECQRYAERAKNSERAIPPGLSFENVVENRSLPPCSLSDFMDYLVYIEHDAENLQFYLWYKDYVRRFEALSDHEKQLSPEWVPETTELRTLAKDTEGNEGRKKRPMVDLPDNNAVADFNADVKSTTDGFSRTLSSRADSAIGTPMVSPIPPSNTGRRSGEVLGQAGLRWQPFTVQPMREEVNRIMRHYLAFNSARELNLSHKDRALCLHALQHTTHPSAFSPAVIITEAALRGQSHPNFIRWSICNGNRPRIFFVRTTGVSTIVLGFVIGILLVLSSASRWWRVFAGLQWFLGIATLVASYKGLCLIMHKSHNRNLRPWEEILQHDADEENERHSFETSSQRRIHMAIRTGDDHDKQMDGTAISQSSTLSSFGPKNNVQEFEEKWARIYKKKSLLRKVFDKTTWTQDENLRLLQDRIVIGAIAWSFIATVPLTALFIALPKGNYY